MWVTNSCGAIPVNRSQASALISFDSNTRRLARSFGREQFHHSRGPDDLARRADRPPWCPKHLLDRAAIGARDRVLEEMNDASRRRTVDADDERRVDHGTVRANLVGERAYASIGCERVLEREEDAVEPGRFVALERICRIDRLENRTQGRPPI